MRLFNREFSNQQILIGIVVLLVLVAGGVFAWQQGWISPKATQSVDETAGWQTYRNEEFSFEMKYPQEWKLKSSTLGVDPIFEFSGEGGALFVLPRGSEVPVFRPLGVGEDSKILLTDENEDKAVEFHTQSDLVFGYRITFKTVPSSWESFGALHTQAKVENIREYQPLGMDIPIDAEVNDVDVKVIKQILSTFQFIEETADWKVYRDEKSKFEFRYPEKYIISPFGEGKTPQVIVATSPEDIADQCFYKGEQPQYFSEDSKAGKLTLSGTDFCITKVVDAGAGSVFPVYYYTVKQSNTYITLKFEVQYSNCGGYYGQPEFSACEEFKQNLRMNVEKPIENIISTFRFIE